MVKKLQVNVAGGIHLAVAIDLFRVVTKANAFVCIKAGKKMASAKDYLKVLSLGVRQYAWVDVIVESEHDEAAIMARIEKLLCGGKINEEVEKVERDLTVEAYKKNMFALLGKPGYEKMRENLLKKMEK